MQEQNQRPEFDILGGNNKTPIWEWYSFNQKDGHVKREEKLDSLLAGVSDIEDDKHIEVKRIVYGWLSNIGIYSLSHLNYTISLLEEPHSITWKEFNTAFELWNSRKSLDELDQWLENHSKLRLCSLQSTANELFNSVIERRNGALENASAALTVEAHSQYMGEAEGYLNLIEVLFKEGLPSIGNNYYQKTEHLKKYLESLEGWMHFDINSADAMARNKEAQTLKDFIAKDIEFDGLCDLLLSTQRENTYFGNKKEKKMYALLEECIRILSPQKLNQTIYMFRNADALSKLHSNTFRGQERRILLDPQNDIHKPPYRAQLLAVFDEAKENSIVHKNCREFFSLIANNGEKNNKEDARAVASDKEFISALWKAVVSQQLQFRMLSELRDERQMMIGWGVEERILFMPNWLNIDTSGTPDLASEEDLDFIE